MQKQKQGGKYYRLHNYWIFPYFFLRYITFSILAIRCNSFHFMISCIALVVQSCPTLCDPMDCSLKGCSVHGNLQGRILKWIAIPFSRKSWSRDQTWVSCIAGRFFMVWATKKGSWCLIAQWCLTLCNPHGLQHARPLCPSPSTGTCSNSCPLNQQCHPTISSSVAPPPIAFSFSQHQGIFQWICSSPQVAKILELQHQSFQGIFRVYFL